MARGIFVVGTDTEVGKTVVSAGLVLALRSRGHNVGVMKPIATGCMVSDEDLLSSDARFLAKAAGKKEINAINPIRFAPPLAPAVAARLVGESIDITKIKVAYNTTRAHHDYMIVEGIGGVMVPITDTYFVRDLILELSLPALIVARLGLGTINHTLMTVEMLKQKHVPIVGIILNITHVEGQTFAARTNPEAIERLTGLPLLGVVPHVTGVNIDKATFGNLEEVFPFAVKIDQIMQAMG